MIWNCRILYWEMTVLFSIALFLFIRQLKKLVIAPFTCHNFNIRNRVQASVYCSVICIVKTELECWQRWVQAFVTSIFSTLVSTTNGLERQHQKLKYTFLHDTSNGSLYDLVTIMLQSYIPSCYRRFISHFVMQMCAWVIINRVCVSHNRKSQQPCTFVSFTKKQCKRSRTYTGTLTGGASWLRVT